MAVSVCLNDLLYSQAENANLANVLLAVLITKNEAEKRRRKCKVKNSIENENKQRPSRRWYRVGHKLSLSWVGAVSRPWVESKRELSWNIFEKSRAWVSQPWVGCEFSVFIWHFWKINGLSIYKITIFQTLKTKIQAKIISSSNKFWIFLHFQIFLIFTSKLHEK